MTGRTDGGRDDRRRVFFRLARIHDMSETTVKKGCHRNSERYHCPSFFSARISCDGSLEESGAIADLSLKGLKVKTGRSFDEGSNAEIELKSEYTKAVRIRARVMWVITAEDAEFSHIVGFSITRIRVRDWFRFMKIIAQIRKEVW